ncbi:MAG: hypothetical protein JWR69_3033 [Pedosphaera sp.]|nr:hypothetical protein [Pedosphaera sp.]
MKLLRHIYHAVPLLIVCLLGGLCSLAGLVRLENWLARQHAALMEEWK